MNDKEELKALARIGLALSGDERNPFIDSIIPEHILHQYDPHDVLEVAVDNGCIIAACCSDGEKYRANGVWLKPSPEMKERLRSYHNISHSYCPDCYDLAMDDIAEYKTQLAKRSSQDNLDDQVSYQ